MPKALSMLPQQPPVKKAGGFAWCKLKTKAKPVPAPSGDPPLMTLAEAAKRLGISTKTLREHVSAGRIRYVNLGTEKRKAYRFTPKNLATFIEHQKIREVPKCPSFPTKKASIKSTSFFGATVFSEVPKPGTGKKPKP